MHASHVLEHVPNPIRWFEDVCSILAPGGKLHLKIPDSRYTFDFRRRPSGLSDLVAAYVEDRTRPTVDSTYASVLYMEPKHNIG